MSKQRGEKKWWIQGGSCLGGVFLGSITLLLLIEQWKNGCGVVKSGRVPGKIELTPPL